MTRSPLPFSALRSGVIAVLRASGADAYERVCEVLIGAGVDTIELTLTTPGTVDALHRLQGRFPDASFGAGTVLSPDDARACLDAGARFLVTPAFRSAVLDAGIAKGVAVISGAMTPTEVFDTWCAGAAAVKVFPASTVGAEYVGHLAGPFPNLVTIPSGGVGIDDIGDWIRAGSSAVSLGGPLLGDSLRGGNLRDLTDRARRALDAVNIARLA